MSTETHQITVSGVSVDVVRKSIKNLHLGVYPPDGRVRVAVPLAVSDAAVRVAVINKLRWIRRQREIYAQQARQPAPEMVQGESHYLLGHRYRLRVTEGAGVARVYVRGRSWIDLHIPHCSDTAYRERVLQRFYRDTLRELVPELISKWQTLLEVELAEWAIKRMKTRWGTCNTQARRIWINAELAKKPLECVEYIIAHELLHLRVKHHDKQFQALMDKHLPKWRLLRDELNATPLAHERWS